MRFTGYTTLATFVGAMLLAPLPAPAANTDMQSLQRDVADLQDQLKSVQKTLDSKLGAIEALLQQSVDTAGKTNSNVNNLNIGISQTLQTELKSMKEQLNSVNGLSVKVDNTSNDVSDLYSAVKGLVVTVNREQQQLNDIANQLKLLQAPAAPPPGPDTAGGPGAAAAPPPTGQTLFENAGRDQDAGRLDLALKGFNEFLRLYPNDGNAIRAQYNIGNIYYSQGHMEDSVKAFDAVIEQYPKDPITTPSAYYMKGMALKKEKKNTAAIASFQAVIKEFPHSEEAPQAKTQLTSLGASAPAAPARHRN